MGWDTIVYEVHGPVARIVMNRPEKHNAENFQLADERDAAFRKAEADSEIRVIILAANGKSFSAGHDVTQVYGDDRMKAIRGDINSRVEFERRFYFESALRIQNLSKPTIAAVQGNCIAGGLMTAAMCDLIIAADDAKFSDPLLGFVAMRGLNELADGKRSGGDVSLEVFYQPWQLGVRRAKELLFTGEAMTPEEAKEIGFINRVVPRAELEEASMAMANRIALANPGALALVKKSFQQTLEAQGQRQAYEYHFLLHQLRHDGLAEKWLRPPDTEPGESWQTFAPLTEEA
jgi:enoyl-CoA hydratase/carnithine racemase